METFKDGRGYPTRRYKSKSGAVYDLTEVQPPKRKRSMRKAGTSRAGKASTPKAGPAKRKKRSSSGKTVRRKVSMASRIKKARKGSAKRGNKRKGGQLQLIV